MIQLAEDIEYLDSRKVLLSPKFRRVLIEVASNNKIDIAVVDAEQMREFDDSDTGEDVDIDWIENVRSQDLEFEFPDDMTRHYLLFWNCNEDDDAIVAYKITPIK